MRPPCQSAAKQALYLELLACIIAFMCRALGSAGTQGQTSVGAGSRAPAACCHPRVDAGSNSSTRCPQCTCYSSCVSSLRPGVPGSTVAASHVVGVQEVDAPRDVHVLCPSCHYRNISSAVPGMTAVPLTSWECRKWIPRAMSSATCCPLRPHTSSRRASLSSAARRSPPAMYCYQRTGFVIVTWCQPCSVRTHLLVQCRLQVAPRRVLRRRPGLLTLIPFHCS